MERMGTYFYISSYPILLSFPFIMFLEEGHQLPQPLDILPCPKPTTLHPRQLHPRFTHSEVKKLPRKLMMAGIKPQLECKRQEYVQHNGRAYPSLQDKYAGKHYQLVYENRLCTNVDVPPFSDYTASNYVPIGKECGELGGQGPFAFDSAFQCGNAHRVYEQKGTILPTYDILLHEDIKTMGFQQWYCFRMKRLGTQAVVRINIVNLEKVKTHSLTTRGMKPWACTHQSWSPLSTNHCGYMATNIPIKSHPHKHYHQLTFQFECPKEQIFISMLPIYGYSRLCRKIDEWKQMNAYYTMEVYHDYVYSQCLNIVPILIFTPKERRTNETVMISGRAHPAEVWSSFLIEHLVEEILAREGNGLTFVLLPMLNVDGVVYGNSRCDISGIDINRSWSTMHRDFLTYHIVHKINRFLRNKPTFFMDLHSHSQCMGVFSYVCSETKAIMKSLQSCSIIDYQLCTYIKVNDLQLTSKKTTLRAYAGKFAHTSLTVEMSYFGYIKNHKVHYYDEGYLHNVGMMLLKLMGSRGIDVNHELIAVKEETNQMSESEPECYYSQQNVKKIRGIKNRWLSRQKLRRQKKGLKKVRQHITNNNFSLRHISQQAQVPAQTSRKKKQVRIKFVQDQQYIKNERMVVLDIPNYKKNRYRKLCRSVQSIELGCRKVGEKKEYPTWFNVYQHGSYKQSRINHITRSIQSLVQKEKRTVRCFQSLMRKKSS